MSRYPRETPVSARLTAFAVRAVFDAVPAAVGLLWFDWGASQFAFCWAAVATGSLFYEMGWSVPLWTYY